MVTVQVGDVLLHPPPVQPWNVEPAAGVAVSWTTVCEGKTAEHAVPQLIPAGELVTVPCPEPAFEIVRVNPVGGGAAVVNDQT